MVWLLNRHCYEMALLQLRKCLCGVIISYLTGVSQLCQSARKPVSCKSTWRPFHSKQPWGQLKLELEDTVWQEFHLVRVFLVYSCKREKTA